MKFQRIEAFVAAVATVGFVAGFPKYETSEKGYHLVEGNDTAIKGTNRQEEQIGDQMQEDAQNRPPRFGFTTYSHDVQGTGNVLPGVYGPVRLDIGGLVLGTIVGLGAFFILPKLLHVVANPYAGYKRSEDESVEGNGLISDVIAKVQESIDTYNLDSSACLQRAICFSVQSAGEKVGNHTAGGFESALDTIARNDAFKMLLDGTDWKKAIEVAENGANCSTTFSKCPHELVTAISAISKYLLS